MPYQISHDDKLDIIHLRFTSPDTLEEHLSATRDIHELSEKHHCKKVLVDLFQMSQSTKLTITEQHQFTESWNPDLYKDCVFAIVLPEKTALQDEWYFMIHLIKLAGTIGQPFYSIDEALAWFGHRD